MGTDYLKDMGCFSGVMKMFWNCRGGKKKNYRGGDCNIMTALDATELYTLKWLIACYMNFTSILKEGES